MSADLGTTATMVRRALPLLGRGWIEVAGQVSGLLLDITDQEITARWNDDAAAMPAPLAAGVALRAWGRLQAAIRPVQQGAADPAGRTLYPALGFVTVASGDVAVLGAAAARMGQSRGPGGHRGVADALERSAAATNRTCEQLIVQVARVHGVLDLDLGADGDIPVELGADGRMFVAPPPATVVAHRRIAGRVYTMWQAGQDPKVPP